MFADPSEAVFAIVGNFRDLEPHRDLRDALLRRLLQAAVDDPRPGTPHEQVQAEMARRRVEPRAAPARWRRERSEEHTSELQSLMRISYAVFCLKNKHRCFSTSV